MTRQMNNTLGSSLLFKIFSATFFRGLGALAAIGLTLTLTRNFSTDIAGQALFSIALVTIVGQILSLGGHLSATKLTGANLHGHRWTIINGDLSALSCMVLTGGCAALIVSSLSSTIIDKNYTVIISAAIGLALVQLYTGALIGAKRQNLATLFLNGVIPVSASALILFAIITGSTLSLESLTNVYAVCCIAAACVLMSIWLTQQNALFKPSLRLSSNTITHIKSSYPIVLAQLSTQYASQFATVLYLTSADFAYFSSALRTSLLISFVLMAANLVVAGRFAEHFDKQNIKGLNQLSLSTSKILLAIALPLCVTATLFSIEIMTLFGEDYGNASTALTIMVLGQLINVATGATSLLLSMCGREAVLRKCLLVTLVVAVVSSFSLTPLFGLAGAAIATALAVATQNLLATYYVKQHLGFNPLNLLRKV